MLKWLFILGILTLFTFNLKAQTRLQQITTNALPQQLDSLSIVPGSVKVFYANTNNLVDSSFYDIDYLKAILLWKKTEIVVVDISYKVFPILFTKNYFHKDVKLITQQPVNNNLFAYKPNANNNLFALNGLNKSGSISRGIMFGNNQNLAVNSNMILQLSGKIANSVEILAAISDNNLPIQPDGNTQQLNEFDRVFIQLKKDSTTLTAGDYELKKPNSYFMNFYKRTQGGTINHSFKTKKGVFFKTTAAAAVAKGRSARNNINGLEGNQGPYRLTGNNAETFIIIIAGTERIYIDGLLLTRGQDNDYVIDYNTAEIVFTTKRLITQNTRIAIEFEYTDKNYARSLTYINQEINSKKLAFRLNYYNEKDNRNLPFLQNLSTQQKQFLAGLGNNITQAFYPNITEVGFNATEVLYQKINLSTGGFFYEYTTDPLLAKYRLGFSYVGEKKGNYNLNTSAAANGKVYTYIAPIGGVMQGNFEPITLLVTPKQMQLFTVATDYTPRKNTKLSAEFASSNNNLNLFAPKNNANSKGYGFNFNFEDGSPLQKNNKLGWVLNTKSNYEFVSKTFSFIERYRTVEFNRDFNLENINSPANEHLLNGSIALYKSNLKNIGYALNMFLRQGNYSGYQHKINGAYQLKNYTIKYNGSLLNTNANLNSGNFYKQLASISRPINNLILGLNLEQEHNFTKDKLSLKLTGNSFSFTQYTAYLQSLTSKQNKFKIDYTFRTDKLPRLSQLLNSAVANTINAALELTKNANSILNLSAGYRFTTHQNNFSKVKTAQTLLGRIDYQLNAFKGFINTSLYYEIGNGQEPKRDLVYLEVLPAQGVYAWNDYNNNGVKELNEFEIARFPDQAKFIRIFTPTTDFVQTNFTAINQTIRLQPSAILKNTTGLNKLLNRFNNQLSYKIDRKILATTGWNAYNPFNTQINANNLVSLNSFFRNTLFFNRNNPVLGIDFNYLSNGAKIFLSNGFDTRNNHEIGVRFRLNPVRSTSFNLSLNNGNRRYLSELFTQRNFEINYLDLQPELSYQLNTNLRLGFLAIIARQKNATIYGGEKSNNLTLSTETRYNILNKGLLTGKLSYIKNNFKGNSNSAIGYEMLAGLQTGNNLTWGLGLQRNISAGVQINLNYEARKANDRNAIHTGNMQVRAFF